MAWNFILNRLREYGRLVMFSHTVFSLPFGLISMLWAYGGLPPVNTFVYILVALIAARTGANAFNRLADRKIDARNPRTADRPLQRRSVSVKEAWGVTVLSFALLAFCAWRLNTLCLILLPLALFVFVFYSYTKRFTWLSHFVLGLACGGAPVGAWAAAAGTLNLLPFALGGAVCFWVAGFDIIYATQDIDIDRAQRLHSIPARFGRMAALNIAALSHAAAIGCLLFIAVFWLRGWFYLAGTGLVALILTLEHIASRGFLRLKIDFIAYSANQIVSAVFFVFALLDFILEGGAAWTLTLT